MQLGSYTDPEHHGVVGNVTAAKIARGLSPLRCARGPRAALDGKADKFPLIETLDKALVRTKYGGPETGQLDIT
jgi:hypothetical protein